MFLPVFRRSKGEDGFVSLEVSPTLAYDEEKTVSDAQRLFKAVARPNVMIKVPAISRKNPKVQVDGVNTVVNVRGCIYFSSLMELIQKQ